MSVTVSAFAGLSEDQLRANLATAQQALFDLSTGGKPIEVFYQAADAQRRVTYKATDVATLRALIAELQRALGMVPNRRAFGVRF